MVSWRYFLSTGATIFNSAKHTIIIRSIYYILRLFLYYDHLEIFHRDTTYEKKLLVSNSCTIALMETSRKNWYRMILFFDDSVRIDVDSAKIFCNLQFRLTSTNDWRKYK